MRLLVLSHAIAQPRVGKRIRMLRRGDWELTLASYDRTGYLQNPQTREPVHSLGAVSSKGLMRRVPQAIRSVRRLRALGRFDLVYAFSSELALHARLAGISRRVALEVGDIHRALTFPSPVRALLRQADGAMVRTADAMVYTSDRFRDDFYHQICGIAPKANLIIENRIDRSTWDVLESTIRSARDSWRGAASARPLTIGYFGILRCERTWRALVAWAEADPANRRVVIRGHSFRTGPSRADLEGRPGVEFRGVYQWPEDIGTIYSEVDLVCASYPAGDHEPANWQWARTNRFYEACCFGRPMLTLQGSADAERVERAGIGTSIDFADPTRASQQLATIGWSDLERWRQNLLTLDRDVYLEDDDSERLNEMLHRLVAPHATSTVARPRTGREDFNTVTHDA